MPFLSYCSSRRPNLARQPLVGPRAGPQESRAHDTTPYSLVLLPDSTDPFHMLLLLVIASNSAVITRAINKTSNKTVLLYSRVMLIIYEALLKLIK